LRKEVKGSGKGATKALIRRTKDEIRSLTERIAAQVKTARELRELERGTGPIVDEIERLEEEKELLETRLADATKRLKEKPSVPTMETIEEEDEPAEPLTRAEMNRLASEFARKLPQLKGKGMEKHIKAFAESMKGGSRNAGFIRRMMAEVKLKHDGEYKNPTAPLSKESEMNAPVAFDYFAMPKESREMSQFIMDHFFKIRPYKAGEREELNPTELKKLRDAEAERQRRSRAKRRGGGMYGGNIASLIAALVRIQRRMRRGELSDDETETAVHQYLDENENDNDIFVAHYDDLDDAVQRNIRLWLPAVIRDLQTTELEMDQEDEETDEEMEGINQMTPYELGHYAATMGLRPDEVKTPPPKKKRK
jgi:hypothetical protein